MTPTERVEKVAQEFLDYLRVQFFGEDAPFNELDEYKPRLIKALSLTRREALLEAAEIADQFSKVGMSGALTATDITRRITALADKESESCV